MQPYRLASNTAYGVPVALVDVVCRVDIRGIQAQIVSVAIRVHRRGPIEAVCPLIVARATTHAAGKDEVYRIRS